ncbi:MAG TPA: ABC transporter ATP-binding protein [Streptosporangiaceae bacterium]|nr:ABC transporter ATP-binding protein [Streptosporangiaceae bacterium]
MSVLEIDGLRTFIRQRSGVVRAVDGISFAIEPGQTVGLVGESGCGKTMTGLSIMGLLPGGGFVAEGAIRFGEVDLATVGDAGMRRIRGNEIGMVFQDPMTSLNPTMTIGHQIAEVVREHRGLPKADAMARAEEVLALVGMPRPAERLSYYPHQLSGGMRQRVMIGIALACEPKLLIADEPTTALDVTIQDQILVLLDELKERLGMAVLLITHDLGVIAGRADRVLVMYAGKIVEKAPTGGLFRGTRHPYTAALFASIPRLDQPTSRQLYSIPGLPPDLIHPPDGCRFAARCRYATQECRDGEPALGGPDPEHPYACFHPVGPGLELTGPEGTGDTQQALGAGSGTELLVLDHVVKEFPVTSGGLLRRTVGTVKAVSDVTLTVPRGGTLGLVGESGCGKTTIGRMVVALERPTSGRVIFEGQDLGALSGTQLRRVRRDLQIMFQDPYSSLDPRMRVGSILREPLQIQGAGSAVEQRDHVASLLHEVGLSPRSTQLYPHEFSGGQRQRIGLARALALSPKVIVADEPVSALDVSIRSQILNLMRRLQAAHGLTYVVISHDLSVVRYLADRIGVMYLGKLVEAGSSADVYERAAHPYTLGLLRTIPVPDPEAERAKHTIAVAGELPSSMNPPSGCRFRTRCPMAQEICAAQEPPLRPFGHGHLAACHFPLQTPVPVEAGSLPALQTDVE